MIDLSLFRSFLEGRSGDGSVYFLRPQALREQARAIRAHLPNPMYAVKSNSLPQVLETLADEGVLAFDVASKSEIETVLAAVPGAVCHFMHPVKLNEHISFAYEQGVRAFALDDIQELDKILDTTRGAKGSVLIVRIGLPPSDLAVYDMTGKFGASPEQARALLGAIAARGLAAGMTFHVGSQCLSPDAYVQAIDAAAAIARSCPCKLSILDVGGGFPARYLGSEPDLDLFGTAITNAVLRNSDVFPPSCRVQSEPGRAMVAKAGFVAVRVVLRRGFMLFVNDGIHGLLSELRWMPGLHPIERFRPGSPKGGSGASKASFVLAGTTCDSGDLMPGPYALPADTTAGDWLIIGFLGAYANDLCTNFNGFGRHDLQII